MEEKAGLKVHTWEEFLELGRKHPAEPLPPKPQDLCTIMYTSGTTGNPKVGLLPVLHLSHSTDCDTILPLSACATPTGH